jgi:hypothetical protein
MTGYTMPWLSSEGYPVAIQWLSNGYLVATR